MRGIKLTILLLSMLTMMAAAIIAPSLPDIANAFRHFPQVELLSKLILSIPALFIAVIAPFAGHYIDKFGRLKLLYLGLLGYAISGTSGYFLDDLYFILVSRMLLGMSIGIIMTTSMTLVGDYFSGVERQKFIGHQSAFIGFAGVLFMLLGGFLASYHWRMPFLVYLFSLLLVPMVFFFLKGPSNVSSQSASTLTSSNRSLKVLFLVGTLFMILFYLMPTQLPFLLKFVGVNAPELAGYALAINALGMVSTSFFYSSIKKRSSFLQVAFYALIMMGLGYFLTGSFVKYELILMALFIAGLGLGLFIANLTFWVLELSPPQIRGKNMGILTACLFSGQFLSPFVAQPVIGISDLAFLFRSSLFLIVLIGLCLTTAVIVFRKKIEA